MSKLTMVSDDPYICYIDNFLTPEECDFMISKSIGKMSNARVSYIDSEKDKYESKYKGRTNKSYWMDHYKYPESLALCNKIADLLECDYKHFEKFQMIHYGVGEEYKYHYDGYDKHEKEKYEKYCKERGNRLLTVLVYLNDVEEGGETGFSKIKKYDGTIKIKAKKGRMVVFHNLHSNGEIHRETMHAGLPVIKGEKWAFNLWLRER